MSDIVRALGSGAHVAGIATVFTFSTLRLFALRRKDVAATRVGDNGNGIGALLLYGSGLWRLFWELEKPTSFYTDNPVFWLKVGLLSVATNPTAGVPMVTWLRASSTITTSEGREVLHYIRAAYGGERTH